MAKHAASDSEDEATSPKRARLNGGPSSLPGSSPPPLPTQDQEQAEGSEGEDDQMDEDDPEEVAKQTQQLNKMKSQTKTQGQVAEAGIIERVDLQDFMSHKLTTVKFGPQINFLVGMNGSGKSAVLTGITMALGGSAKLTNRATKAGGFVREGCHVAKAAVVLRNRGTDAYMPDTYGHSITIERTLRSNGTGAYKISAANKTVVDTKKATLDAILDHFNIQVDNPMTVLSQDQSRQFLASATAKDKYMFFLRGTQLQQLTEEYEQIRSNTETMEEALDRKREVLPELKEAYKRAKERANDAKAAMNQQERVEKMKEELAWSYVDEVEDSIRRGESLVEKEKKLGPKIEQELKKAQDTKATAEDEIAQVEEAAAESTATIEQLTPEVEELTAQVNAARQRTATFRDQERKINGQITRMKETIAEYDTQIAAEKKKLERDVKAERQPIFDRIEQLNDEVAKINSNMNRARHEFEDLDDKSREWVQRLQDSKEKINAAHGAGQKIKDQLNQISRAKGNSLFAYGNNVVNFLRAIEQERSWRDKPIGPIGTHVKLKDQRYAALLESYFSQTLNAFIVTNEQDRMLLTKLHRQHQLGFHVPIITVRPDAGILNEVGRNEPHPEILTVRRALSFTNQLVEQCLITAHGMERNALVQLRPEGDELLRRNPANVLEAYSADLFKIGFFQNKSSTSTVPPYTGTPRFNPDLSARAKVLQDQLQVITQEIAAFEEEKREIDKQLAAFHQGKMAAERTSRQGAARIIHINRQIELETDKLREDEPTNIAAIEDARKESQAELDSMLAQYAAGAGEKSRSDNEVAPIVERKHQAETELRNANKLASKLAAMLETANKKRVDSQQAIDQFTKKLDAHNNKVADMQRQVDALTPELERRKEQASSICDRPVVEKKRSSARLQQEIENLQKALKEREKRQGATVEQIVAEMAVRRKIVEEAMGAINDLAKLVKLLEAAYHARIKRWADFRDSIASRAKMQFLFHLSNRGFTGKLTFDHEHNALHVRVQTEETGKRKKQYKDSRALSGGEKSFSTICLLLTMWESVGCPLRCLDEFDVFMDAVNRRISMKMMVDTGKAANNVQFILITPQDMGSLYGPEVRVSKLDDPERNQGVLAVGR